MVVVMVEVVVCFYGARVKVGYFMATWGLRRLLLEISILFFIPILPPPQL